MAPGCRNMYELAPASVLLCVLLYCNWCILFVENMECKKMQGMSNIKNKKSKAHAARK